MLESAQISKMSMAERLQAMEQLWDALCRGGGEVSSPEWHEEVLARRKARANRGGVNPARWASADGVTGAERLFSK